MGVKGACPLGLSSQSLDCETRRCAASSRPRRILRVLLLPHGPDGPFGLPLWGTDRREVAECHRSSDLRQEKVVDLLLNASAFFDESGGHSRNSTECVVSRRSLESKEHNKSK